MPRSLAAPTAKRKRLSPDAGLRAALAAAEQRIADLERELAQLTGPGRVTHADPTDDFSLVGWSPSIG